jgi:hypothetical protein
VFASLDSIMFDGSPGKPVFQTLTRDLSMKRFIPY